MSNAIKHLEWDSHFFGFKIGRITRRITQPTELKKVLLEAKSKEFRCLYFELSSRTQQIIQFCNRQKYRCVDRKTYLWKRIVKNNLPSAAMMKSNPPIRKFKKCDFREVVRISEKVIAPHSRFCADRRFGSGGEKLYGQWVKESQKSRFCDAFFVFVQYNKAVGFVTIRKKSAKVYIDLFGVDPRFQGRGIGTQLIRFCERWAGSKNIRSLHVITQGLNKPAMSLYLKCGFRIKKQTRFYHLWI